MDSSEIVRKKSSVNGFELSNGQAVVLEVEGQTEEIADDMNNNDKAFSDFSDYQFFLRQDMNRCTP